MTGTPRTLVVSLAAALLILILVCGLAAYAASSGPAGRRLQLDSPPIGGHIYSLWLLPCDAFNPGMIVIGRDLMLFSRYPPPGITIPLAGAC